MDDREIMDFLFTEEEVDFVDDESDNVEKQETDINDHDGHRLRLRRQINRDGFDGVTQRDLLELMLCSVQPRQDVNIVCDELMEYFGDLRRLLKSDFQEFSRFEGLGDDGVQWLDAICTLARMCKDMNLKRGVKIANYSQLHRYAQDLLSRSGKPCCFQLLSDAGDYLLFQRRIAQNLRWGESSVLACAADDAFSSRARNSYLLVFTDDPSAHPNAYDLESLRGYSLLLQNSKCAPRDILFMNEEHCVSLNQMRMMNNLLIHPRPAPGSVSEDENPPKPEGGLIVHRISETDA